MLVSDEGVVEAFVMSCRVFQRRVVHAFLCAIRDEGVAPTPMRLAGTAKNGPFLQFAERQAFGGLADGLVSSTSGSGAWLRGGRAEPGGVLPADQAPAVVRPRWLPAVTRLAPNFPRPEASSRSRT